MGKRVAASKKTAGKRANSPGKKSSARKEKRGGAWKILLVALALLAAMTVGGYAWMCAQVDQETILADVTIGETSIQGMTPQEAEEAVQEAFRQSYENQPLEILLDGESYTIVPWDEEGSLLSLDLGNAVEEAMEYGHGDFITRGVDWLKVQLDLDEGSTVSVSPEISDLEGLRQKIQATGITQVDTAVASTYEIKEDVITVTKGTDGVVADLDTLTSQAAELIVSGQWPAGTKTLDCATLASQAAELDLQAIYDQIYAEPKDATLDKENDYAIVESQDGLSFNLEAAQEDLAAAQPGDTFEIVLIKSHPEIDTENLRENLFADTLGSYSTNVGGSSGRKSNVRLSMEKCDGTILLPGETFSYNDVVGQRTKAAGFSEAPAYNEGQTVQEVGGGICQTSSTLYAACLYANLEITERYNHSFASSYIGLGLDATVSWGGPDYKFTNNTKYPIKVEGSYSGGKLTMTIVGTKTDSLTVKMRSETLETIDWTTKREHDSSLDDGETKVKTTPYTGYKVQTYRELYDGDGNLVSTQEEAYSYYKKRDKVILYG